MTSPTDGMRESSQGFWPYLFPIQQKALNGTIDNTCNYSHHVTSNLYSSLLNKENEFEKSILISYDSGLRVIHSNDMTYKIKNIKLCLNFPPISP